MASQSQPCFFLIFNIQRLSSAQSANGVIREANGTEFLKADPQARLQVGLQKQRQHGLPGKPRFLFTFSCQFVHFVVPSVLRYQSSEIEGCAALNTTYTPQDFSEGSTPVIHSPDSSSFQPPSSAIQRISGNEKYRIS